MVSPAPESQDDVDKIYKDAEVRYKLQIPPGYKDEIKGQDKPQAYRHNSIIYQKKYGDYLIWKQILQCAKQKKPNCVIFVTDDRKEDWWNIIDCNGLRIL